MKTMNKFAKFLKAVGRKLSSATTEAMTDQSLSISLDNYYTKKYNNCDNFKWHKAHPLSGAKFSRRGLSPTATPTIIISKQHKNNQKFYNRNNKAIEKTKFVLAKDKLKNYFIAQKDGAKKLRSDYFFTTTLIFRQKSLNFRYNKNIGLLCCFITNPFWTNLPKLFCSFGNLIIQSFAFNTLKNVLKSLLLPFVVLGLSVNFAFADGNTNSSQTLTEQAKSIEEELAKIFVNSNDIIIENGVCEFKCRDVKNGYITQINGFDFAGGITYCEIFPENMRDKPLKYNANQKNINCIKEWQSKIPLKPQYATETKTTNLKSQISQTTSDKDITLSRFLSGIVTLDPKIINRDSTNTIGQVVLANGVTTRSGGVSGLYDYFDKNPNDSFFEKTIEWFAEKTLENQGINKPLRTIKGERTSSSEGFNKANLAYFSNLFENMNEVYQHLQWLLFVVVGSFFLISIGTAKFQRYLENNGEANSNQPYLHKFMIPLITIGFFFMPIPEGNSKNDQATMVQNIIRYFTAKATDIADIASAKGGATYINKMYSSVGGISADAELMYQANLQQYIFIKSRAIKNYEEKCSTRFASLSSLGIPFADMSEQELKEYMEKTGIDIDFNQASGTSNDIKFEACIALEQTIWEANAEIKKAQNNLLGIKNYYENNKLQDNLKNIDKYLSSREKELGWINSPILASSSLMIELQDMISDNIIQKDNIETNTQKNQNAVIENQKRGTIAKNSGEKELLDSGIGYLTGKLSWFILPGTNQMYQIIKDNASTIIPPLGAAFGSIMPGVGTILGGSIGWFISNFAGSITALLLAPALMESILTKVPTLVIAVAGMIAVASYLVALCKYFYLSPFVVAFSLTTKRLDKIVNFLVTGIAIFFKPVLIVLFIYLALFLNVLINELFVFMSIEQFGTIKVSAQDFWATFTITSIQSILKIFGILGSTYIVFKLIISGPDWAMKLVGIDSSSDNMISQSLTQNLEKRSFMA